MRGIGCRFGDLQIPPVFKIDGMPSVLVMDYEDVVRVLRSNDFEHDFYPMFGGETLIHLNGEKHRRYRKLLAGVFSPRAMKVWEECAQSALEVLLAPLHGRRSVDLLPCVVRPYPATVFARIMDFPAADADRVRALGVFQGAAGIDPDLSAYAAETEAYLAGFVDERSALSDEDLAARQDAISLLIRSRLGEERLTRDEIMATCQLLVIGGVDTTHHALANVLYMLLTHADVLEEVKRDRSLVPAAMEETMRLIPSAGIVEVRRAVRDVEIGGVDVAAGTPVVTCEMTANRDPMLWPAPDVFDIHRKHEQHLSFATGPINVLGMHLARMQIRVALNTIFDIHPDICLDDRAPRPRVKGFLSEGPSALPVILG
ncbi:MAG: cytochrome P450 [Rhodospirillales bacterium]|nr:cytochrome P450 [Rhodospirillales bacterium]